MGFRAIYITSQSHLSFKNNYLIVRGEETRQIFIPEIYCLIIDSNLSSVSIYLLNELIKNKIKLIICDEKHNPSLEMMPCYGSFNTSKMISRETNWNNKKCDEIWQCIVKYKIHYQSKVLKKIDVEKSNLLNEYINEVEIGDRTNREGHAAKVYFNALFGKNFSRDDGNNDINAYLNYGYSILLSLFNREIIANGYLTQIGLHHKGATNPYNLSCDLMEIFRPIVDDYTINNYMEEFNKEKRKELINLMNKTFIYEGKKQYLTNIVSSFVKNVIDSLESERIDNKIFEYERI